MLKVCKFGGSSVAGAEQFRKVRDIVLSDDSRRVVVISAAGKRTSDDHKLTDLLYLCHAHLTYGVSCAEILAAIRSRFVSIRDELGLSYRVEDEFDAYAATLSRDTSVDELVSRGEYFTARLMAETLSPARLPRAIRRQTRPRLWISSTSAAVKCSIPSQSMPLCGSTPKATAHASCIFRSASSPETSAVGSDSA